MGAVPHHPFFTLVIESLIPYDRNWRFPYITVMYSTGPLFLSVIWQEYKRGRNTHLNSLAGVPALGPAAAAAGLGGNAVGSVGTAAVVGEGGRVRVLMGDEYTQKAWSFFYRAGGSSWHGKDARFIFWMGGHWLALTVSGFLLAGLVGVCLWWMWSRVSEFGERRRKGGGVVGAVGGSGGGGGVRARELGLWGWLGRSLVFRRGRGYVLVDRHEV